jgi:hypothetical protein
MISLAQTASRRDEAVSSWLLWFVGLIVAVVIAGFLILLIRRSFFAPQESVGAGPQDVWGLDDLRRLRDQGEITVEEYETLRARAIKALKGDARPVEDTPNAAENSSTSGPGTS